MSRVNITLSIIVFTMLSVAISRAGNAYEPAPPHDLSAAWCTEDLPWSNGPERFVPDGAIIPVGPYYFRVCQDDPAGHRTREDRIMRMFYNPERVEGMTYTRSVAGLTLHFLNWREKVQTVLYNHKATGVRKVGGVTYRIYQYYDTLTNRLLPNEKHVYVAGTNDEGEPYPPHVFSCDLNIHKQASEPSSCFVSVSYDQVHASKIILGGGPDLKPILVEEMPTVAQDIYRLLKSADVTDDVEELTKRIPLID